MDDEQPNDGNRGMKDILKASLDALKSISSNLAGLDIGKRAAGMADVAKEHVKKAASWSSSAAGNVGDAAKEKLGPMMASLLKLFRRGKEDGVDVLEEVSDGKKSRWRDLLNPAKHVRDIGNAIKGIGNDPKGFVGGGVKALQRGGFLPRGYGEGGSYTAAQKLDFTVAIARQGVEAMRQFGLSRQQAQILQKGVGAANDIKNVATGDPVTKAKSFWHLFFTMGTQVISNLRESASEMKQALHSRSAFNMGKHAMLSMANLAAIVPGVGAAILPPFVLGSMAFGQAQNTWEHTQKAFKKLGAVGWDEDSRGPQQHFGEVGAGLTGVVGELAKSVPLVGKSLHRASKFGEELFKSTDDMRKWSQNLHNANMEFANFSAGMAAVAANRRVQDIILNKERGDRRSASAGVLSDSQVDVEKQVQPGEDLWANIQNRATAMGNKMIADALEKGTFGDTMKKFNKWLDEMGGGKKGTSGELGEWMAEEGLRWDSSDYHRPKRF